jgi:hypothetical protein
MALDDVTKSGPQGSLFVFGRRYRYFSVRVKEKWVNGTKGVTLAV